MCDPFAHSHIHTPTCVNTHTYKYTLTFAGAYKNILIQIDYTFWQTHTCTEGERERFADFIQGAKR